MTGEVVEGLSMTTLVRVRDAPDTGSVGRRPRRTLRRDRRPPWSLLLAVLVVLAGRLPFVNGPLSSDEAGFLTVARQWRSAGPSLYGAFWVDRPPLLLTIFRAASLLGGTVPLRLIGTAAAVVTVLAVGLVTRRLAGAGASTWAALTVAALLVSPLAGARPVNGELLAAPFIAVGTAALLTSLTASSRRRTVVLAVLAGGCGVAAVLVKQNMVDVLVVATVLILLTVRRLGWARISRVIAGLLAGGALTAAATAWWTLAQGTSLRAVWFAMYGFRIDAARVIAMHPSPRTAIRQHHLGMAALGSGLVLAVGLLVLLVASRRRSSTPTGPLAIVRGKLPTVLAAWVAYDVVSIWLGESFWGHYLVQLALPVGLVVGMGTARWPLIGRSVAGFVLVSAAVAIIVTGVYVRPTGETRLGDAIGSAAHRRDSIVSVWGHAEVTRASGLRSPYPYLWYLPTVTLDPRLTRLDTTLAGPRAPTWFVSWSGTRPGLSDTAPLNAILREDYHRVAHYRRHTVYLHNGVHRATPTLPPLAHLSEQHASLTPTPTGRTQ